jgi:hypothetical protein
MIDFDMACLARFKPNLHSPTAIRHNADMVVFQDIQDVEEWLAPLDYIAFWEAVAPYDLGLQDRDHCDGLIAGGKMNADRLLSVLKTMAMMELRIAFGLKDRIPEPPEARWLASIH